MILSRADIVFDAGHPARLVLMDLVGAQPGGQADLEGLHGLVATARARRLQIAHCYRRPVQGAAAPLTPWGGLMPTPDEPVFMRERASALSSRQFCAWAALSPAPLIFLGRSSTASLSAQAAARLGHDAMVLISAANANGGADGRELCPAAVSPVIGRVGGRYISTTRTPLGAFRGSN